MFETSTYQQHPVEFIKDRDTKCAIVEYTEHLKREAWEIVVKKLNIEKYFTTKARESFRAKVAKMKNMLFSRKNISILLNGVFHNASKMLEDTIIDSFDECTRFNYDNKMEVKGWKTNNSYKVNRKIVLPYTLKFSETKWGNSFSVGYGHMSGFLDDFDKSLCYMSGVEFGNIRKIRQALKAKFDELGSLVAGEKFSNNVESHFFKIKFFKNGNLHLTFKDEWTWNEFNIRATHGKKWLPPKEWEAYRSAREKREKQASSCASPALLL